jgi:hypothetical protein
MSFVFSSMTSIGSPSTPAASAPPAVRPEAVIDPSLLTDEIPARFIDALANQFGFGDAEQDLRLNLHGFAKVLIISLLTN